MPRKIAFKSLIYEHPHFTMKFTKISNSITSQCIASLKTFPMGRHLRESDNRLQSYGTFSGMGTSSGLHVHDTCMSKIVRGCFSTQTAKAINLRKGLVCHNESTALDSRETNLDCSTQRDSNPGTRVDHRPGGPTHTNVCRAPCHRLVERSTRSRVAKSKTL